MVASAFFERLFIPVNKLSKKFYQFPDGVNLINGVELFRTSEVGSFFAMQRSACKQQWI
jgi:hypothetical protein